MTPRFTFPLERVLSVREQAKDLAREELAAGLAHKLRGEALLREAERTAADARTAAHGSMLSGTSAADLHAAQLWAERTERERVAAELDLGRRDAEVRSRRVVLDRAARDHAAVDRLRERQLAEHVAHVARVEQAELDELALQAHRRGRAA